VGGGTPPTPSVSITSLGVCCDSINLPATVWADNASSYSYVNPLLVGNNLLEHWATPTSAFGTITSSVTVDLTFFHQFAFLGRYAVFGGGSPTAPTVTSTQFGLPFSAPVKLFGLGGAYFLDAGQSWAIAPNPPVGSTSTERWESSGTPICVEICPGPSSLSGTVSGVLAFVVTYYHQFFVKASYLVSDGTSAPSAPTLTSIYLGNAVSNGLSTTPVSYWFDAGTACAPAVRAVHGR